MILLWLLFGFSYGKEIFNPQWIQLLRCHPDTLLNVTIALRHTPEQLEQLERRLYEVSDPIHPSYGNYISNHEITAIVSPGIDTLHTVCQYLQQHFRLPSETIQSSTNQDYLFVTTTARMLESIFQVVFHHYQHKQYKDIVYIRSSLPYTIPETLKPYIHSIHGINYFPTVSKASTLFNHTVASAIPQVERNFPSVLVPTTWRGTNVTLMAALRCHDGSFKRQDIPCERKIEQVLVTVDPIPKKLNARIEVFKPYELFDAAEPLCAVCTSFSSDHYTRGQLTRDLCTKILMETSAPWDTLFCRLVATDVTLAAPSHISVATVFQPAAHSHPPPMRPLQELDYLRTVSAESQCLQGLSQRNCSKIVSLMPDVHPEFLRELYGVPEYLIGSNPFNHQAVSAFLKEHYSENDLSIFYQTFNISPQHPVYQVLGPNDPAHPTGEASLDVQTILGVAPNVKTWFWSVGGLRENALNASDSNQEPFLKWILDYNALDVPPFPLVHSVSYDDNELGQPRTFTDRMNVEFMKAGLLGRTLLFAAGDDGAGGSGLRTGGSAACDKFRPEWPSTSPYVTSVGGTIMGRVEDNGNGPMEEVVSDVLTGSVITTGGGFSYYYPRPYYQKKAVDKYLSQAPLPPDSFWNRNGRGYPDISAIASNYMIMLSPRGFVPIAGTSASTPAVAGLISLLNDVRLNKKLPPLGFLNPLLYRLHEKDPSLFHDVRSGSNNCSIVPEYCCAYGYHAAPGWDAVSGVGTLNLTKLLPLLSHRSPFRPHTMEWTTEEEVVVFMNNEVHRTSSLWLIISMGMLLLMAMKHTIVTYRRHRYISV